MLFLQMHLLSSPQFYFINSAFEAFILYALSSKYYSLIFSRISIPFIICSVLIFITNALRYLEEFENALPINIKPGKLILFLYKHNLYNIYHIRRLQYGPRQANLVLIAYASSDGSGEPAHPRSLPRTFAARSYKQ